MDSFCERLLDYLHISKEEFFAFAEEPSFSSLPRIDDSLSAKTAKERILEAIEKGEKILLYGDYDCDGVMATSIMKKALDEMGADVTAFIPSRYIDGYGINENNAQRIAKSPFSLIIAVDNGISAVEPISFLLQEGKETIVIDHHEAGAILPPAVSLIHPDLIHYGEVAVSAGYLCFAFSRFLLNRDDPYLATLAALSTISDCMPMKQYNRTLVALALRFIRKYGFEEISLLTTKKRIDEKVLSMEITPTINAVGRMETPHKVIKAVDYFSDPSSPKLTLSAYLIEQNQARKTATKEAESSLELDLSKPGILLLSSLKEGLNGLLANKLMFAYHRPTAVFSPSEANPDVYVGSLRGKKGFSFLEFFHLLGDLPLRGGGHELAGGISIEKEKWKRFEEIYYEYCASHPFQKEEPQGMEIALEDITMEHFRFLRTLGPFGKDFEEPQFVLRDIPVSLLRFSRSKEHVLTSFPEFSLNAFGVSEASLEGVSTVSFIGTIDLNEFKGRQTLTFYARKLD
ncbi:MAG: DHH family phosphoesterase [Candidatus Enteromonas sp.]|nr:DHH family phosphoesterase [Candidatus Enteromonas sp.]